MTQRIDHGDDGDEVRTETELEALTGEDLIDILATFADYGGDSAGLQVRVSVPDIISNRGLRSARLLRSASTGEWVLHLVTE